MSLVLPEEIVVERVLSTLRVRLARELAERDFIQQEIADQLRVTQTAVSMYLNGEATIEERIDEHPRTRIVTERIAEGFASGEMDGYDALAQPGVLRAVLSSDDRD